MDALLVRMMWTRAVVTLSGEERMRCVIYARVSTKEQQAEGYSIPAQTKAIRAFCIDQGLTPVAEFIEAESAGKAGRTQFTAMCDYLKANAGVTVVVAHKQDRLYRNFRDQITLQEDLGIRPRYVIGDLPDTPQGEFVSDVTLAQSKFYLTNLREEVKKGMDEKVAQGGWPHRAPAGYLNDKNTRSLVIDTRNAPHVRYAFERYATGSVSIKQLAQELFERGFTAKGGRRRSPSLVHNMLRNPIYAGLIRHKGVIYPGTHPALVSVALFDTVQATFEPKRNGMKSSTRNVFALRDWLVCAECGCKVTAERHKGHVYYRCTHGKGECSQSRYAREEALFAEVEEVLSRIEVGPETAAALIADSLRLDSRAAEEFQGKRKTLAARIEALKARSSQLLDTYLDGMVPAETYTQKADELQSEVRTLELSLSNLQKSDFVKTPLVEARIKQVVGARERFAAADTQGKRDLLDTLLLNLEVDDRHIASYQYKRPFHVLEKDAKGAFLHLWWAILDLNQ